MQRISGWSAKNGRFVAEDPVSGQAGTIVTPAWLNSVQEELCNLIERAGVQLDGSDDQLHRLLNGRANALTAWADLRQATGDAISGSVLAACETPGGLVLITSTGALYLVRGGHVAPIWEQTGVSWRWADIRCDGASVTVAYLQAAQSDVLRCRRFQLSPTLLLAQDELIQVDVSAFELIGVDRIIYDSTTHLRQTRTLVCGRLIDPRRLVYLLRITDDESGVDEIRTIVRWIEADVDIEAIAHTETLSATGAYAFPAAHSLRRCASIAQTPGGCAVYYPRLRTQNSGALRLLTVTINDDDLSATATAAAVFGLLGPVSDAYDPGLRTARLASAGVLLWCPGLENYAIVRVDGSTERYSDAIAGPAVAACELADGVALISQLTTSMDVYLVDTTGRAERRLTVGIPDLAARAGLADHLDRYLTQTGDTAAADIMLPPRAISHDGAAALCLPGLVASTRSPLWGPWTAYATPTPARPLGVDNDGRLVAITLNGEILVSPPP